MKKLLFLTALWSVVITATAQQEAVQAKKQWFLKPMAGINVSTLRDTGDEDAVNDQRVPDDRCCPFQRDFRRKWAVRCKKTSKYLEVSEIMSNFAPASTEVSQLYGASIAGRFFSPLSF